MNICTLSVVAWKRRRSNPKPCNCTTGSSTIQTLKALLSSEDERQVLYALDLSSNTHPDRWNGSIDALIRHPSGVIRARTIAMLSSWNHPAIAQRNLSGHPDFETTRLGVGRRVTAAMDWLSSES